MDKQINEKILKVWGSGCLLPSTEIELGKDVEVKIVGGLVKIEDKDNFDGTKDRVYVVRIETAEITEK